jgi:hypothetical protein
MGRFLITWADRNNQSTHSNANQLRIGEDISEFQQKGRFGIRKPLFYPLNYGNSDNCDFRFSTADCNRTSDLLPVAPRSKASGALALQSKGTKFRLSSICSGLPESS